MTKAELAKDLARLQHSHAILLKKQEDLEKLNAVLLKALEDHDALKAEVEDLREQNRAQEAELESLSDERTEMIEYGGDLEDRVIAVRQGFEKLMGGLYANSGPWRYTSE